MYVDRIVIISVNKFQNIFISMDHQQLNFLRKPLKTLYNSLNNYHSFNKILPIYQEYYNFMQDPILIWKCLHQFCCL